MSSPVGACASAGDPFCRRLSRLPGASPDSKPLPGGCPSVAQLTAPLPRLPARRPRLPGWPPQPLPSGPRAFGEDQDHPPTESASASWTWAASVSPLLPLLAAVVLGTFPLSRLACAVRYRTYSAPSISAGQEVFLRSQGYPPRKWVTHKTSSIIHRAGGDDAQEMHRLCTASGVDAGVVSRLNVVRDCAPRRRHHHHSIAHVGTCRCAL